jgi:hypothetical protein
MTQDRYTRRGKVHPEVAALLDRSINGELTMAEASFRRPHQDSNLGPADYQSRLDSA